MSKSKSKVTLEEVFSRARRMVGILFVLSAVYSYYLLVGGAFKWYEFLTSLALPLMGIALYHIDNIKNIDLKNLVLHLREVKKIRKEIYAKAEELGVVTQLLLECIVITTHRDTRFGKSEDANKRLNQSVIGLINYVAKYEPEWWDDFCEKLGIGEGGKSGPKPSQ